MKLISVNNATRTKHDGYLDLSITWEVMPGNPHYTPGVRSDMFTWHRSDPHGIGPQVTKWMEANPGFPIADYVPPVRELERPPSDPKAKLAQFLKDNPDVQEMIGK